MLQKLANDEIGQDKHFVGLAIDFIQASPGLTVKRGFSKVWAAFSWELSPEREVHQRFFSEASHG